MKTFTALLLSILLLKTYAGTINAECVIEESNTHFEFCKTENEYAIFYSSRNYDGINDTSNIFKNWIQAGLKGKTVQCITSNDDYIFAGTSSNGLWISSDLGKTWNKTDLKSENIITIKIFGKTIYAGTYKDGLWVSNDNGKSWKDSGLNTETAYYVTEIGNTIFVGTSGDGLWTSRNGGKDWERNNVKVKYVTSVIKAGTNLVMGTYELEGNDIWISNNNGESWYHPAQKFRFVKFIETNQNNIFVLSEPNGAWERSKDNNSDIWVSSSPCVFFSEDNGTNWKQLIMIKEDTSKIWSLSVFGDYILAGTNKYYFFKKVKEKIWHKTALQDNKVFAATCIKNVIYAGTADGVYLSSIILKDYEKELIDFKVVAEEYRNLKTKPEISEELRRSIVQATSLTKDKKYNDAIQMYLKITEADMTYPDAHFNLSLLLAQVEDYEYAIFEMNKYIMLVPNAKDARAAQDKIYEWELNLK